MDTLQIIISILLSVAVLAGISMMSKVKTAVSGNLLSALAILVGIVVTLFFSGIARAYTVYPTIVVGALIGGLIARRAKMIQMPQIVALFNGFGGGASALVGILSATYLAFSPYQKVIIALNGYISFVRCTSLLAIAVGMITLVGSLVAAGKLHRVLPQRPIVWSSHSLITLVLLFVTVLFIVLGTVYDEDSWTIGGTIIASALFGLYFSVRVGGADMPITISLLNSLSGVAGAIAGMAISDIFLVAVGGIVGASGLLLTQIMSKAMNRNLLSILSGGITQRQMVPQQAETVPQQGTREGVRKEAVADKTPGSVLAAAKDVIIVPGYGMALAQAQHRVKLLADKLAGNGTKVRFAIHPVAGRMPGHMNVLLAEADVPYEQLYEMEVINDDFARADVVIVIGANDVMNPAARHAEDTPIYGMPVLNVDQAPEIIICNYDLKPGYAGVENPLYSRKAGVYLMLGDAKESLDMLMNQF